MFNFANAIIRLVIGYKHNMSSSLLKDFAENVRYIFVARVCVVSIGHVECSFSMCSTHIVSIFIVQYFAMTLALHYKTPVSNDRFLISWNFIQNSWLIKNVQVSSPGTIHPPTSSSTCGMSRDNGERDMNRPSYPLSGLKDATSKTRKGHLMMVSPRTSRPEREVTSRMHEQQIRSREVPSRGHYDDHRSSLDRNSNYSQNFGCSAYGFRFIYFCFHNTRKDTNVQVQYYHIHCKQEMHAFSKT